MAYASTAELARYLHVLRSIPDVTKRGEARTKEEVGTGDNSTTQFFLDNACIIAGTYTLYIGASEGVATTVLVETTSYTMDKDNGEITLTTAGKTTVGTNKIYAKYSYVDIGDNLMLNDTELQEALDRATSDIEDDTGAVWADGTAATPGYEQIQDEKHQGKGQFDRNYFTRKYPIVDVETTLTAAVATTDTTITVSSTTGFPSSGYISIGNDKMTYTGKSTTTFTGCSGAASAHSIGDGVYSWVVELSTTSSGTEPSWTVLAMDSDYDIAFDSGKVHLYVTEYDLTYYALQYPPNGIPNRFRVSYLHGYDTIPDDVVRLCLMIASRDLMHTSVRKAIVSGAGEFRVDNVDIDAKWIADKLEGYRSIQSSNV